MANKASISTMNSLHEALANKYLNLLNSDKELTAAELNAVANFLKQNDITVDVTESKPMQDIVNQAMIRLNSRAV